MVCGFIKKKGKLQWCFIFKVKISRQIKMGMQITNMRANNLKGSSAIYVGCY